MVKERVGRRPVGQEIQNDLSFFSFEFSHLEEVNPQSLWVLENFHFQFVVKHWYFDVNRYGLVCSKVTGCLYSDWWDGHEKGKGKKPSLRRAVA